MERYEVMDCCYGTVTAKCQKGVFLRLDNGEDAFAYRFNLMIGTEVLCTVLRQATDRLRTLVSIDSVDSASAVLPYAA